VQGLKAEAKFLRDCISNSYSQIFFSDNKWLALLIIIASFIDPYTGSGGILCLLSTILFCRWLGLSPLLIRSGVYGYNALLLGFAIGVLFKFTLAFFAILILASFLLLMITVWISSVTSRNNVPFLSLPFMLVIWIVLLSTRSFAALRLSERGIYTFNELWRIGGMPLVSLYETINSVRFPQLVEIYFKSLGAIFFQYNIISGILIAIGLLIYSRIAFLLSILGFLSGYFFCYFIQGNITELQYSFIGFNYILTAIAIGGFYIVPSPRSFLLALVCAPLTGLLISALDNILGIYNLPVYSLPFSLLIILVIFLLGKRIKSKKLHLVQFQQYSPEKNLYLDHNRLERFKNDTYIHINLPFRGEWYVSQGHNGKITHKDEFRFAWDFVITNESGKTYREPGTKVEDFYCYGLPILAPAAGYVVDILDDVEDNVIGDVNIKANWGNTIIIKHSEYLYSKLSHLKAGNFTVKVGDYVKKGDVLARCGSSGRSPEPHLHFQLQSNPLIAAGSLKYPIAYYIVNSDKKHSFHSYDYPVEEQKVQGILSSPSLYDAFHFIPGMKLQFNVDTGKTTKKVNWEVFADSMNMPYIYCHDTGSIAYFTNNEVMHYFTNFKGDRKSLLYYFYLGAHKVLLNHDASIEVNDSLPVSNFYKGFAMFLQDFIAPFRIYLHVDYLSSHIEMAEGIKLVSCVKAKNNGKVNNQLDFEIEVKSNSITKFTIKGKNLCITAERTV